MKKIGANRSSIAWNTEGYQVSGGIKQKSNGEQHVSFIIRGPWIDALFLVSSYDAWIMKKERK